MKRFTSPTQKIGEIGERIAERFLVKRDFSVLERNYTKKQGEIDIIAQRDNILYFCEVKTIQDHVPHETDNHNVSRGTNDHSVSRETYNPFENITPKKLRSLGIMAEIYCMEHNVSHETRWQIAGIAVYYDAHNRRAKIDFLDNII